jgi:DtxR family transcriptional regulator, Mn-dependent transcriptional regulator
MIKHLSPNMEMYLKTILRLDPPDGSGVRVKEIATSLGVTRPSVSEALRSLTARGLVVHPSYGTVRLSVRGRRAATSVNHRFEVLRKFFADILQVEEKIASRDACEIEHVVGVETLRRLTAFVEYVARTGEGAHPIVPGFEKFLQEESAEPEGE